MNQQTIFKQTEIGKIPEDWEVKKIENLCDISSSKRIFYSEYVKKGIPFYRSKEIIEKSNGNHISTELFISTEKYEEIKNKYGIPIPGDLLLTSVGTLGIPYIVQEEDKFYFKDGNLTWFKNFKNLNVKYLYYWFNSKFGKDCLNAISIGSTQKALTIKALKNIDLIVPPLPEQHAIAKILSDLDSKIELLQKQNKTLEAIGQAIFKHWFVDFEFPNEEGKPYKSSGGEMVFNEELGKEIPKGWEVGKLGDILSELESGSRPKGGISDTDTDVPSIGAENILGLGKYNYSSTKYVSEKFYQKMKAGKVKDGDVLLYKDGAKLGRKSMFMCGFPFKKCCINEHVFILRNNNRLNQPFLFFWLDQKWVTKEIRNLNANSAQPGINKTTVSSLKVLIPEINILNNYYELQSPLLIKLFKNSLNIQTISKTRDLLLPKLMSGKIRVPVEVE